MTNSAVRSVIPERFLLLPTGGSALKVMVAAQCVGYVWLDKERWLARGQEGRLLETSGQTVLDAVTAVFAQERPRVYLQAR